MSTLFRTEPNYCVTVYQCHFCHKNFSMKQRLVIHLEEHKTMETVKTIDYLCERLPTATRTINALLTFFKFGYEIASHKIDNFNPVYFRDAVRKVEKDMRKEQDGWHSCDVCGRIFKSFPKCCEHHNRHIVKKSRGK